MPKHIERLQEGILLAAREALLSKGYAALTMRGVARACGVAVGTVYNYYPSKEMLVASVMLEDWLAALTDMQRVCASASSVSEGLRAMYEEVARFCRVYRPVWALYSFGGGQQSALAERHRLLVRQLAACVRTLLTRCEADGFDGVDVFLAENLLVAAGDSEMTLSTLLRAASRILERPGTQTE